ncbi:putative methyltransferase NSUN7 isoform X2 [Trichomycterus rosablanca]
MVKQDAPRRLSSRPSKRSSCLESSPVTSPSPSTPSRIPDRVYLNAAATFRNALREKAAARQILSYGRRSEGAASRLEDPVLQRRAFDLAFNTLKYQELLEDIMIDSCFYMNKPVPDDLMSLVVVMLYDLQDRKFLPREPPSRDEETEPEVRQVEECLLRFRTKLAASLARCRIKHDLLSIDHILPESIRLRQERGNKLPVYCWVNTLLTGMKEVCEALKTDGFSCLSSISELEGRSFCEDRHCRDLLVFPASMKEELQKIHLLQEHKLIVQDKSCCVGPCALRPLLAPEGDVLMSGSFSASTVAHAAAVVESVCTHTQTQRSPNSSKQKPGAVRVCVCVGERSSAHREELQEVLTSMGCTNVKLLPESLHTVDVSDVRLQRVQLVLLTPQCSLTAVSNPIDYLLQESGDTELLQDLSHGSVSQSRLDTLVSQQYRDLQHALHFPKVRGVVYSTCSSRPEENEEVVRRALTRTEQPAAKLQPFRISRASLLQDDDEDEDGSGETKTDFFRLDESDESNGCFVAVLTRQPEPVVTETPQEVIAHAVATGLLDGIRPEQRPKRDGHVQKTRRGASRQPRPAHPRPRVSLSSQQSRVEEFLKREMKASSSAPILTRDTRSDVHLPPGNPRAAHQHLIKSSSSTTASTSSITDSASSTSSITAPVPPDMLPIFSITAPTSSTSSPAIVNTAAPLSSTSDPTVSVVSLMPSHKFPNRTAGRRAPVPVLKPAAPPRVRQEVLRPVLLAFPPALFPSLPSPPAPVRPTLNTSWTNWPPSAPLTHTRSCSNATHPRPWF